MYKSFEAPQSCMRLAFFFVVQLLSVLTEENADTIASRVSTQQRERLQAIIADEKADKQVRVAAAGQLSELASLTLGREGRVYEV